MSSNSGLDFVYVVTRNGRRVEPINYACSQLASDRFRSLVQQIKKWDPKSKDLVNVVKTTTPHRVR